MAGLVPAIHVLVASKKKNVDARVKPGNDTSCQNMITITPRGERRGCPDTGERSDAVLRAAMPRHDAGRECALGGVDIYRIHKMIAARVTTAR